MAAKNGGKQQGAQKVPGSQQRPAQEFRLGRVRLTLWLNHHEKGDWYSMTFSRSYREGGENGQWKSASSFGRDDLLPVAELARMAFHWIHRQYQQQSAAADQEGVTDPGAPESKEEVPF